jgi:hypothetical protein
MHMKNFDKSSKLFIALIHNFCMTILQKTFTILSNLILTLFCRWHDGYYKYIENIYPTNSSLRDFMNCGGQ